MLMRWEALFDDLEGQMSSAEAADTAAEVAAMARAEFARTGLTDRLRGQVGSPVSLRLRDGRWLRGAVVTAAPRWLLLDTAAEAGGGRPHAPARAPGRLLLPLDAVERFQDLGSAQGAPAGEVERRLGWGGALRALVRDRAVVTVLLATGDLAGTLDRVGADHVDVAVHPLDAPRRRSAVTEVASLPFPAVLGLRAEG